MTVKEKVLSVLSLVGVFFSAVFYVLFQQKKDENLNERNENLENENKRLQKEIQEVKGVTENYKKNMSETEIDFHSACSGDVDAGIQLMHKLSEKGKARNNCSEK